MGEGILPATPPASIPSFAVSSPSDMTTDVDVEVSFAGAAAVDAAADMGGGGNLAVVTP